MDSCNGTLSYHTKMKRYNGISNVTRLTLNTSYVCVSEKVNENYFTYTKKIQRQNKVEWKFSNAKKNDDKLLFKLYYYYGVILCCL